MVVVDNAVVAAGLRVLERRQRLVGAGEGPHGDPGSKATALYSYYLWNGRSLPRAKSVSTEKQKTPRDGNTVVGTR